MQCDRFEYKLKTEVKSHRNSNKTRNKKMWKRLKKNPSISCTPLRREAMMTHRKTKPTKRGKKARVGFIATGRND
jgi:hypothetical protein